MYQIHYNIKIDNATTIVGVMRYRRVPNQFVSGSQEVKYNIIAYLKLLRYFDILALFYT